MKQILTVLIIFGLGLSGNLGKHSKTTTKTNEFKKYIQSLDKIPLPLKTSSVGELPDLSKNYYKKGFEEFKQVWTSKPLGILFNNGDNVVTIDLSMGDNGYVPFILSYDSVGNKIDSLGPYEKSGRDLGYLAVEYMTIYKNRKIMVTDTVKKWKLNKDETDIIKGSMTMSVDTVIYHITNKGKILKEK